MAKLTSNQKAMLLRRGLDPKLYSFVKETYTSVYFRHVITGTIKIITKGDRYN